MVPDPTLRPTSRAAGVLRAALPVLVVAWVVGTAVLLWNAFGSSLTFLGETATAAQRATTERYLIAAAWVAVGLPVLGLTIASWGRSRAGRWTFAALLLVGGALALLVATEVHVAHRNDPQPRSPVTICQEHSGGGTECPGG